MALESQENHGEPTWLGRLWQNFLLLGEGIELSDSERLEQRIAALEAGSHTASNRAD